LDPDPLLITLSVFSFTLLINILVLALLLVCSALISGSEIAFFSLSPSQLDELKNENSKNSNQVLSLIHKPKELLATILISNNFVNVGIVILSTYVSNNIFADISNPMVLFLIQVVIITFLILMAGEVLPKIYAHQNAKSFALKMSNALNVFQKVIKPLIYILIKSTSIIDKRLNENKYNLSVDELSQALEITTNDKTENDEKKILEGIVKFGNTDVKQIMKARVDVTTLNQSTNFDAVIKIIVDSGYSRIPVYKDNFDKIKGILYIKDLIPHLNKPSTFNWVSLLRDAYFVPETKKIDDLLKEFQTLKIHLAVVVDEYGGTSGIVTLEDILEEIVGEISDEFDDEDVVFSKLDEQNFVFEGKTLLNDFYRIMNINGDVFEQEKGESDSLAGFLLEVNEIMPNKNDIITFKNIQFKIESVDKKRIKRIKATILDD